MWCECTYLSCWVVRSGSGELLGCGRYPVELQERARLHFPYTTSTYYHVESVLQKRLKRQDHPLLIVSIYIYNSPNRGNVYWTVHNCGLSADRFLTEKIHQMENV